jgi:hypothetical protein
MTDTTTITLVVRDAARRHADRVLLAEQATRRAWAVYVRATEATDAAPTEASYRACRAHERAAAEHHTFCERYQRDLIGGVL